MTAGAGAGVFLDRDGVLTSAVVRDRRPYPPATADDVELLPGVATACEQLKQAGATLVVVTNQPDVARGSIPIDVVEAINRRIASMLPIDDFRVCPHDDADACACRKPKPGLLEAAATAHSLDLARCVMVGDRWRDVDAGAAAGCGTVFVDRDYDERRPAAPDVVVGELAEAVPWILERWSANHG